MAGLCGVVGTQRGIITDFANAINTFGDQQESLFRDDLIEVGYVDHAVEFDEQPATTEQVSIWCWGDILGHEYRGQYTPRSGTQTDAEYCASLYETYGLNFVAGLNSEFLGIIYDHESETVSLFTDRLGSRPIYYTQTPDGSIVFSSLLQSLAVHPEVSLKTDSDYLVEFLTFSRVFGVHTPVKGVQTIPPASVVTYDVNGEIVDNWRYWWPNPTKQNRPFLDFVDQFKQTFRSAVHERIEENREHGLLLSGGADSRLVIQMFEGDLTSFHMNEDLTGNNEAETARKVANQENSKFVFLKRGSEYYPGIFRGVGPTVSNFNGIPHHSHAYGFADQFRSEVDTLFSGHYGDTIFGSVYLPLRPKNDNKYLNHILPPLYTSNPDSKKEFLTIIDEMRYISGDCAYTQLGRDLESVLSDNITEHGTHIQHHGVTYPDWEAVTEFGMIYPITNGWGFNFYETTNQIIQTKYPFLDNRLIDLALQMPSKYRIRRNIVESALSDLNPELASIPHPSHGLPLHYPYYIKYYMGKASALRNKVERRFSSSETEHSIGGGGSWPNHATLIRQHSFVGDILEKNEDRIRTCPYLDYEAAQNCYTAHLNGENYTHQLYALIAVLESSLDLNGDQSVDQ